MIGHDPANSEGELIDMDTSELINSTVKAALDAWQKGDRQTFLSFFTSDATSLTMEVPVTFSNL